jgi:hypothetical protein
MIARVSTPNGSLFLGLAPFEIVTALTTGSNELGLKHKCLVCLTLIVSSVEEAVSREHVNRKSCIRRYETMTERSLRFARKNLDFGMTSQL